MKLYRVSPTLLCHFIKLMVLPVLMIFFTLIKLNGNNIQDFPFEIIKRSIVIKATVEGVTGNFIIDTGSPCMLLNKKYFFGLKAKHCNDVIIDLHGIENNNKIRYIKDAKIGELNLPSEFARVFDFSEIERIKGISIAGIFGHHSFKDKSLVIDFSQCKAFIFSNQSPSDYSEFQVRDSFPFHMIDHIPCIDAKINGKKIILGIDTGSEVNVLNKFVLKGMTHLYEQEGRVLLQGIGDHSKKASTGRIEKFEINHKNFHHLKFVLTDFSAFNQSLDTPLDGLLGMPFFEMEIIAIDYNRHMVYFYRQTTEMNMMPSISE